MSDDWPNVCVLCSARGRQTRLKFGHCCARCADLLLADMRDIPNLAEMASASLTPQSSRSGGNHTAPGSKPPLNVDAVDPALTHVPGYDAPLLTILEEWERMIRQERGYAPYGPTSVHRAMKNPSASNDTTATLRGVATFLATQTEWIISEPTFPLSDYADEVHACHRALRRWNQDSEQRNHGLRCPTVTDDNQCGHFIAWAREADSVECPRCRRTWTMEWLMMVASGDDLWLDAEAISNATKIHEQTIRKWARAGHVRKRGMLYSVADVQTRRGLAKAHSA